MKEFEVTVTLKIDVDLIKKQKQALILNIENAFDEHKEYLEGILNTLDAITDEIPDEVYDQERFAEKQFNEAHPELNP